MSDTWRETRDAVDRLKRNYREADEDARWRFGFYIAGNAIMGTAIVGFYGWYGVAFLIGLLVWAASEKHN
jgi:hypothetical protein